MTSSRDHGPLEYVLSSHRFDLRRLRWEHARACRASASDAADRGGSFRLSELDRRALGLRAPTQLTVRANTLVLADIRGFHRRGEGRPGARRLALYGSFRPSPFVPIPY